MYKMLNKNDVVEINKLFDKGRIVNEGSLDFAISSTKKTKDWVTQLAYFLRVVVVDHAFEEGNKRTAAALFVTYCKANKKAYDIYKIDIIIRDLIQKRISDISKIRRMIKNATV